MKKVLIITYYWPPSGGAGVQRWLKLSKYMRNEGVTPYVLTVDPEAASYMQRDDSLVEEVPDDLSVTRTSSFEPINLYARFVGKEKVPTAGFSNVDSSRWTQKLINSVRSNLFIPDPRRGWNKYAYREAVSLIEREGISDVITTSPPHSSQLIGLRLKKQLGIHWIADLRDPWTDIYYYELLGHSFLSDRINRRYEKQVLEQADQLITVSKDVRRLYLEKSEQIDRDKFHVVPNGYDAVDFVDVHREPSEKFTLGYTGTMADTYNPRALLEALRLFGETIPPDSWRIRMVGQISEKIKRLITEMGLPLESIPPVPHDQINHYQVNTDLLLLVIPDIENPNGILTGKLFEYLATENPIINLGPKAGDAAEIIRECQSGKTFERDEVGAMVDFVKEAYALFQAGKAYPINRAAIARYSREEQAKQILEFLG